MIRAYCDCLDKLHDFKFDFFPDQNNNLSGRPWIVWLTFLSLPMHYMGYSQNFFSYNKKTVTHV